MRTTYKFYAWSSTGGAGDEWAWVNIDWTYSQTGKSITITGISYAGDRYANDRYPEGYWYVGSAMKFGVIWSDGTESIVANGTYNFSGGNYRTTAYGAGFVDKNGVPGIFSDCGRSCPVSHTFSSDSGGFGIRFGSTLSTINAGNPQSYRDLEFSSGSGTNVTFAVPPSMDTSKIWTSNPSVYRLSSGINGGINWGVGHNSYEVKAVVSYSIDGNNVSYTAYSTTAKQDSYSFTIDAQSDTIPWNRVPDDETVTVKWTVKTNIGATGGQKDQYCQKSYNAYVIEEGVNNGAPVEADLIVSNTSGSQPNKTIRRIDLIT